MAFKLSLENGKTEQENSLWEKKAPIQNIDIEKTIFQDLQIIDICK